MLHRFPVSSFVFLLHLSFFFFTTCCGTNINPSNFITQVAISSGSSGTSTDRCGKRWIGDISAKQHSSTIQIKGSSTTSTVTHKSICCCDPVPYGMSRISHFQFSYTFQLNPGQKLIRLHFNPAPYKGFERFRDSFNVEAGSFTLLTNFSASLTAVNSFAKVFLICLEENQSLDLIFSPVANSPSVIQSRNYAFVNGIEIIPVPEHLSYFHGGDLGARVVGRKSLAYIDSYTALELVHRVDAEWDYAGFDDMTLGMSWQVFSLEKANEEINNVVTWRNPVNVGFRYLIRIYFCELQLKKAEIGGIMFKFLICNMIVDTNTDVVKEMVGGGDSVFWYRDYVVVMKGRKQEGKRDLLISMQSNDIKQYRPVKRFEIFKLSNHDNSLASPNPLPSPPLRGPPSCWNFVKESVSVVLHHRFLAVVVVLVVIILVLARVIVVSKSRTSWEARDERLCRVLSWEEVVSATGNFSNKFLIGEGGFGKVFKGHIDNGKTVVAIKRWKPDSKQGEREFWTEIETLSRARHCCLVSLIGYCMLRKEMIVVYEYMARGTLADCLYKDRFYPLTWKQRLNICIQAARGLEYLHTGLKVIHHDVKASNILLNENFEAKVSDIGLAKLECGRNMLENTKVGTRGYLDPHYLRTHEYTRESDTYAFGVVLLQVLCGKPAMITPSFAEDDRLAYWALNKINSGEVKEIVDSELREIISPDNINNFVGVANMCLRDEPKERPTMTRVILELEYALEQHNKFVSSDEIIAAVSINEQLTAPPPAIGQTNREKEKLGPGTDGREPKKRTPVRIWVGFWNKVLKKRESLYSFTSGRREADIQRVAAVYSAVLPTE